MTLAALKTNCKSFKDRNTRPCATADGQPQNAESRCRNCVSYKFADSLQQKVERAEENGAYSARNEVANVATA